MAVRLTSPKYFLVLILLEAESTRGHIRTKLWSVCTTFCLGNMLASYQQFPGWSVRLVFLQEDAVPPAFQKFDYQTVTVTREITNILCCCDLPSSVAAFFPLCNVCRFPSLLWYPSYPRLRFRMPAVLGFAKQSKARRTHQQGEIPHRRNVAAILLSVPSGST
jgi:hypothetical protein